MRRIGAVVLLGLFATTTQSCQEASAPGPGTPIVELPELLAQATCLSYDRCGGEDALEYQKNCLARLSASFAAAFGPVVDQGVADGRIVYNPDFSDECSAQVAACQFGNQPPSGCLSLLDGQQIQGESCKSSYDCRGEASCVPGPGDTCPATCQPWAAVDEPCLGNDDCKRGLFCNVGGVCEAVGTVGAACGGGMGSDPLCDTYLVCIQPEPGSPDATCESTIALQTAGLNDPCGATTIPPTGPLCETTLSCTDEAGGAICLAGSVAGASCKPGFPDPCPQSQYCDATTCAPLPVTGEACVTYSFMLTNQCAAGYFCDVDTKCQPLIDNGDSCQGTVYSGQDCFSGTCRDNKCVGDFVCP